ncbi:MAG: YIP1 family protein [Methanobacteriota archaeon]
MSDSTGGRPRGLRGIARTWIEVLVRPHRAFENGITPGDQAPALTFAVAVAAAFTLGLIASDPGAVPVVVPSSALLSGLVVFLVVVALGAPVGLHLTAAVATVSVVLASVEFDDGVGLRDRGGVSETVQAVAYASSPMALAGPAVPELRVLCGAYAAVLLIVGLRTVHGLGALRTVAAALPPATLGYGVGYRVVAAARTLLAA